MINTLTTPPFATDKKSSVAEMRATVQMREGSDDVWQEVTRVPILAHNSAGFCVSRPCVVGRLLSLVLPMPVEMRAFDKDTDGYAVMAIVQNCYKSTVDGQSVFEVRVGFVGKNAPDSYRRDPRQSYRIIGMNPDGFWQIVEADVQFKTRAASRFAIATQVSVSLLRNGEVMSGKEVCFTRNISASGVSLPCNLCLKEGDKVKVAFKKYDFYAFAMVRSRKVSKGKVPILHLEFIDEKFPIEKIITGFDKTGKFL